MSWATIALFLPLPPEVLVTNQKNWEHEDMCARVGSDGNVYWSFSYEMSGKLTREQASSLRDWLTTYLADEPEKQP